MAGILRWVVVGLVLTTTAVSAQQGKFAIKTIDTAAPKELDSSVSKLLDAKAIVLLDGKGQAIAELWFCKEIPASATPEQVKKGLTYRQVRETSLLGAVRFVKDWTDYRKQKIKAGVYTMRLGFQPEDGDHMGSSEHLDFVLLADAGKDTKPAIMKITKLNELSQKSIKTGHPAVFMLFPTPKPGEAPELVAKPRNHWVLNLKRPATIEGKLVGVLGIGLTLVGAAE